MFRATSKCSLRNQKWDTCWEQECIDVLEREWGCGLLHTSNQNAAVPNNNNNNNNNKDNTATTTSTTSCLTPFEKTIHQVRHPLRTIESLVTKFCIGGINGNVQPAFVMFVTTLFPQQHKPHQNKNNNNNNGNTTVHITEMSCIEISGYFVYEYNMAMIQATKLGYIDHLYHVEDVTPCDIVNLAGFMGNKNNDNKNADTDTDTDDGVVYKPNKEKVINICKGNNNNDDNNNKNGDTHTTTTNNDANKVMLSTRNRYNKGQLTLEWDDLVGGKHGSTRKSNDHELQQQIQRLTQTLNY